MTDQNTPNDNFRNDPLHATLSAAASERAARLTDRAPVGVSDVHRRVDRKRQQRRAMTSVAAVSLLLVGIGGLLALGRNADAPAASNPSATAPLTAPPTVAPAGQAVWGCTGSVAPPANVDTSAYTNFYTSCEPIGENADPVATLPLDSQDATDPNGVNYIVKDGDTFESIAAQFNTSPEVLKTIHGRPTGALRVGETVYVRTDVTVTGQSLPNEISDGTAPDPAVGMTAPIIRGSDYNGNPVSIDPEQTGRPVLVVEVAHWCPHCDPVVSSVETLMKDGRLPQDLDVVLISSAEIDGQPNYPASEWLTKLGWTGPTIADPLFNIGGVSGHEQGSTASIALGLPPFPMMMVVDKDGVVLDRWTGEMSTDELATRVNADVS